MVFPGAWIRDALEKLVDISPYLNEKMPGDPLGLDYHVGDAVHIAETLEQVMVVGLGDKAASIARKNMADDGDPENVLDISTIPTPMLSAEQKKLAMQVIPDEYWALNCSVCRTEHRTTWYGS